jgi:hypothetical protein
MCYISQAIKFSSTLQVLWQKETQYCNELAQEMVLHEADVSAVFTSEAVFPQLLYLTNICTCGYLPHCGNGVLVLIPTTLLFPPGRW